MRAIQNSDGRLELFARGTGGDLVHIWEEDVAFGIYSWSASAWESLGVPHPEFKSPDGKFTYGSMMSAPAVARNADGRLEAFAVGQHQNGSDLVHIWQTVPSGGPWSGWASLGGTLKQNTPAVGVNDDGRLEVFACTHDHAMWHIWQTAPSNGWSQWAPLGGSIQGAPVVARNADGRLEVFAKGTDLQLWHIWQLDRGGIWSQWDPLVGEVLYGSPSVSRNADGRLEVFARAANASWGISHIWQTAPNGGWSGWAGGDLLTDNRDEAPSVVLNTDGRIEVFGGGNIGGEVLHQWQTAPNNGWSRSNVASDISLGGQAFSTPIVARRANSDLLVVFIRGADHRVYYLNQNSTDNRWADWRTLGPWTVSDLGRTLISESGKIWGTS